MTSPEKKHQAKIIESMQRPDFYSDPVRSVTLRETHISMVFLTGDVVYKVKKAVDMGFLDFTTLENRRQYCNQEVQLNRRLTSDVYLDVVAITLENGRYRLQGPGEAVEYAVKMRQLPRRATMAALLREDSLENHRIDLLADVLSRFYRQARTGSQISAYGTRDIVRKNCEENFDQLAEFAANTISKRMFIFIRSATRSFLNRRKQLFQRRVENGKIRDGHGDLRAGHIYFTEDGVQIIDCIEFNERLRCNDMASDLAFLAMDLDFEGFSGVARDLLKAFVRHSGDEDGYLLMDFYKCYRALVRVKVNCLRLQQKNLVEDRRAELLKDTRRYMDLACEYAAQFARPAIWVVCGMVATGKSTIARELAARFNVRRLSSDLIRKELFDDPAADRLAVGEGIYSREADSITYGKLMRLAQKEIEKENSVIVDATFSRQHNRQAMLRLAEDLDANIIFLECFCSEAIIKERLKNRETLPSVSDARRQHFEKLKALYEPLDDIPQAIRITIDTQNALDATIREILSRADLPTPG